MHGALDEGQKVEPGAVTPVAPPPVATETAPLRKRVASSKKDKKVMQAVARYSELQQQNARYQDQRPDKVNQTELWHGNARDSSVDRVPPATVDQSPLRTPNLEGDLKEIRRVLRGYVAKLGDRDSQGRVSKEWRMVARVLDRIFFIFYLSCIIVSFIVIFAQMTSVESPSNEDGTCREENRNHSVVIDD